MQEERKTRVCNRNLIGSYSTPTVGAGGATFKVKIGLTDPPV